MNYCQTVGQEVTGEDGKFDWLFESARGPPGMAAAPVAASVSDCCTTELDPASGLYKTTCDTSQGCGWVAGPFLSEEMSCRFTTSGATYPAYDECRAAHPSAGGEVQGTQIDWFPPCGTDQVQNCYYPNVDTCLPAVFGRTKSRPAAVPQRRPPSAPCAAYVCDGANTIDVSGRRSFPSSSCRCVTNQ